MLLFQDDKDLLESRDLRELPDLREKLVPLVSKETLAHLDPRETSACPVLPE